MKNLDGAGGAGGAAGAAGAAWWNHCGAGGAVGAARLNHFLGAGLNIGANFAGPSFPGAESLFKDTACADATKRARNTMEKRMFSTVSGR